MRIPAVLLVPGLCLLVVTTAPAAPPVVLGQRLGIRRGGLEVVRMLETDPGDGSSTASADAAPGAPGRLRWQNGETLPGELAGASAAALTWKTSMFDEPLVLDWAALRRYDRPLLSVAPADPFSFLLRNGGHLYGDIVSITADTVAVRSTRHGNAVLPRAAVLSARRVERDGLPAGGATGEAGWRLLSNQGGDNDSRPEFATAAPSPAAPLATGPGGVLVMPNWNTAAFRAMELPPRVDLTFRVTCTQRPDFGLSIEPALGEVLKIETWDDELVLITGDQFLSLGRLADTLREVSLRLCWDRVSNHCQVFTPAGVRVADWHWPSVHPGQEEGWRHLRSGLVLRNKGRDLALELLRVRPGDGAPPPRLDDNAPGVELADGRTIQGEVTGSTADALQLGLGGADAVAAFPLAGVDAIVFSDDAPMVEPTPAMTMTWADGTLLMGRIEGLADGIARVRLPGAAAPLAARLEGLRRLLLPAAPADRAGAGAALAEQDTITAGDMVLHGELSSADDGQPRWLPIGGQRPAVPARGSAYEIRRVHPASEERPMAPALFYTSGGDVLPGELRALDGTGVDFDSPYVEAKTLRSGELDAIQFTANVPARVGSFDDPGWQIVKGDATKTERKGGTLKLEPGAALGHAQLMQCSELRFNIATADTGALRLRMFSPDADGGRGVNLAMMRNGQTVYCGLEVSEGQMESQQSTNVPVGGPIPIRLVITDQQVEVFAGKQRIDAFPVPFSRRAGSGLVIEPAALWGNPVRAIELADFAAEFAPGRVGLPTINAEARTQALTVPRFRRDDPPRQALIAINGDVLRGELLAATAGHFAFRSGLESLRVPRDRVRAAVWLKPPAKDAPPPADPASPALLTKRCQFSGQYANMRLRDYVNMILQWDQDLKAKFSSRESTRRARIRFDQPTVGEALDQIGAAFGLSYRLEGSTVVFATAGTPPPNMRQATYWLKSDAFPGPAAVQDLLAAKGVSFPDGAFARWDANSRQVVMTNTAENQRKLAEVLGTDFGGSLGAPTHWVLLADGTRLGLAVDRFEKARIVGHHPVYGRCEIPLAAVASVRTSAPEPSPAVRMFADWRLVSAPEPVLPGAGGPGGALVGTRAKAFKLPLLDGGEFDLAQEKGKVVVLDFWAMWCAPCIQAMPGLIEAMAEFPAGRVRFVGLNQAEPAEQVRRFLETRGWKLAVAMDAAQDVAKLFGVDAIPHTVVIGPDGKIARVWTGSEPGGEAEVAETVRKLLEAPPVAAPAKQGG